MESLMHLLTPFLVVLALGSTLLLFIPLNMVIHEAGHTLAAAMLTTGPIKIFLGSYGDESKCILIRAGRYEIWLRRNPLRWRGGYCMPGNKRISVRRQIWITVAGPLATLFLFLSLVTAFIVLQPEGLSAPLIALFAAYTGLSFLGNIVPRDKAVGLSKGGLTYNDGHQLRSLLAHSKMPPEYGEAMQAVAAEDWATVAPVMDRLIASGTKNEDVYRIATLAHSHLKDYRVAQQILHAQTARFGHLNTHDRIQKAYLMIQTKQYNDAIGYLKHLLELYGAEKYSLNNMGYVLTIVGRYEEALPYLNKALAIDSDFSHAYGNRGFALLNMGRLDKGKADADRSVQLDPSNAAYGFRNDGLYYFNKGLYTEAITALEKAEALDPDIPGLTALLNRAKGWVPKMHLDS